MYKTIGLVLIAFLWSLAGCNNPPAQSSQSPGNTKDEFQRQLDDLRNQVTDAIELTKQPLTDEMALAIAEFPSLRVLQAEHCDLGSDGIAAIARLVQLEQLKLGDAAIDDSAIRELATLGKLSILNLPDAVFTDEALAQLAEHSDLTLLRFGSRNVTDAGMESIAAMEELRFLHLLAVPITDRGIRSLHEMSWLESFYLDGNDVVTDEALSDLLKQLPELHFHRDQLHLPGNEHD